MNFEHHPKDPRELLRAIRGGNEDATSRLRRHQPRWATVEEVVIRQLVSIHDAQSVLAREQGFSSWPKPRAGSELRHARLFVADGAWLRDRVHGLLRARHASLPAALEQIRAWHPRFSDASDDEILQSPFTVEDACLVYARQHGVDSWSALLAEVNRLASTKPTPDTEPFMTAFVALQARDLPTLQALLRHDPNLANERETNGNTLLNLSVSLAGQQDWPSGAAAIEVLLAAGADANEGNNRGWTPLHQAAYANKPEIARLLLAHGAMPDAEAHGAGGTPLVVALFWGHREVADLLGAHGTDPGNLRVAAGLGRPDLLEACFRDERSLTPEAGAARGFYRPHSGFPDWQPSPSRQEVLDEALVWACKSNRVSILDRLKQAGARTDANPYRGSPLLWAATCNRLEAAAWLLDNGADVNQRETFGGLTHGQGITALHLAAQAGHLPMVRLLIERGADRTLEDDLYHATPERGAAHFGHVAVRDYLRSLSV